MFDSVLVPLDGSSLAECVLPHVVAVAGALDSRVTLLQVLERAESSTGPSRFVDPLRWYINDTEARSYLGKWAARLQEAGLRVESEVVEGKAAEQIIEFARDSDIDLIVLSSHGRSGLSGWNVSSIVLKTILRAYLPIMIVRAYQPAASDLTGMRYRRVVVPLDCSQRAECVLPPATALVESHGAELLIVHVVANPQMPRRVSAAQEDFDLAERVVERNRQVASRYLEQLESRLEVDVDTRLLVSDHTAAALHDLVEREGADLVVMSAHGYSGAAKWPYGSLVTNFIGYGTTPLLIIQDLAPDEVSRTLAEIAAMERKGH